VIRRQEQSESIVRALAFLAAMFALVFGALLPSAVAASARTGAPIVLCSTEGPRTITPGGDDRDRLAALKCAACITADLTGVPPPPVLFPAAPKTVAPVAGARRGVAAPPPARAPPRPPSTAPPLA
jgi:hypothetical protein